MGPLASSLTGYSLNANIIPTPTVKNYSDWVPLIKGVMSMYKKLVEVKNKNPGLDYYHSLFEKQTMPQLQYTVIDLQNTLSQYEKMETRIKELCSDIDLLSQKVEALDQANSFDLAQEINNDISALTDELFVLYELRDSFNDSLSENHMRFARDSQRIIALNRKVLKQSAPAPAPATARVVAPAAPAPALAPARVVAPAAANLSPTSATQTKQLTTTQRLLGDKDLRQVCYTSYSFEKGEDVWLDDLNINIDEMIDLNFMWEHNPASRQNIDNGKPQRKTRTYMGIPVFPGFNQGSAYVCYDQSRKKVFLKKSQDFVNNEIKLLPGKFFILGWIVENQSDQQWSKDSRIVSCSCNVTWDAQPTSAAQPTSVKITNEDSLPQPGYYTLVSQLYQAPEKSGTYHSTWDMEDDKKRFGKLLKAKVTVN